MTFTSLSMMNRQQPRHRLIARRDRSAQNYGLRADHRYDESTGQVYAESLFKIQSSGGDQNWTRQASLAIRDDENAEIGRGARSLRDCTVQCILENISDVTYEVIACIPSTLIRQLWYVVNKR